MEKDLHFPRGMSTKNHHSRGLPLTMKSYRLEHDSMGEVSIPQDALFGPQTQRAVNNFTISPKQLPWPFIRALAWIKQAAAETNTALGLLDEKSGEAIRDAASEIAGRLSGTFSGSGLPDRIGDQHQYEHQ